MHIVDILDNITKNRSQRNHIDNLGNIQLQKLDQLEEVFIKHKRTLAIPYPHEYSPTPGFAFF